MSFRPLELTSRNPCFLLSRYLYLSLSLVLSLPLSPSLSLYLYVFISLPLSLPSTLSLFVDEALDSNTGDGGISHGSERGQAGDEFGAGKSGQGGTLEQLKHPP